MNVRVRFAPSPTGQVHIGNMRSAIFNWLFARHEGGKFLLRFEDTDRQRSTPEAIKTILDTLSWLDLRSDEEPVYQSSHLSAHLKAAEHLLVKGYAYRQDKGKIGKGSCILFKMPGTDMTFYDEIKGKLRKEASKMQDFVIVRSNGTPVFHLANVVDDIDMGITHIIRGDDHIENTYRHVALFHALDAPIPRYAHLPMIVNAQGKPYSKRDGSAFVGEFRENGYLPDALFNYLALLGFSPGENREILPREEMIKLFDIHNVKSSPAQMDINKLQWMNGEYIKELPTNELETQCRKILMEKDLWNAKIDSSYFRTVLKLMHERIKFFSDIAELGSYFFTEDYPYDEKAVKKRLCKKDIIQQMKELSQRFNSIKEFNAVTAEKALRLFAEEGGINPGQLIHAARVAVSGLAFGPGLFDMLAVLGKERVVNRIEKTITRLNQKTEKH